MQPVFTIDGRSFDVSVTSLQRKGAVLDGENAGRTLDGGMQRDIIGTFYNYSMTLNTKKLNVAEYDTLYELLSTPVGHHIITLPYGQGRIRMSAYIANTDDVLIHIEDGITLWGELKVDFTAMSPQRYPGQGGERDGTDTD